uniref:Uncharacterized protein n=1 Tax=Siphoviridae sp. ct6HQ3 TaxID=2825341 RepID=A0A8S5VAM3_9CAUD|nr:MAG TPA: hypothetical protein [Siphoviridae sp. ct6HQ3]
MKGYYIKIINLSSKLIHLFIHNIQYVAKNP